MIVQDPYANSYYMKWRPHQDLAKNERMLGRGGWVATRNYELVRGRAGGEGEGGGLVGTGDGGRQQVGRAQLKGKAGCRVLPPANVWRTLRSSL